jgi:alkylation response protein AidB-like acyl-CoA dehydrogenase
MTDYRPPLQDMTFLLHDVLGFQSDTVDRDTVEAILGEAAKLASEVLAPLNHPGDKAGCKLTEGIVTTAPGFKEAYRQYREGGWNAVPFDADFGGQGLPWAVAFPVQEMWQSANMAFGLCPLLNQGAVEAILSHGTDDQKKYYLPKLISGEWTGTMNLTEPQAGSDLGLIRTRAARHADGSFRIAGQKIYITYGEHDMADNIIHLVLARIDGAPDDVKGISLFIVPKFLQDGSRNDLKCTGIEHKLGIHASPTCTMQFGDHEKCVGYLVGKENEGLKYMFTMMNNARLSVGLQGVAIAERSYQKALAYAQDRVQGKSVTTGQRVPISEHADVRRMLLSMKSRIEAGRALTYMAAVALTRAHDGDAVAQSTVDILTPVVKSWCTDMACDVTSLGVQVHGGMGFVEETGAAQYFRDARILPIYEGTNGIQAADLVFRKTARDGGAAVKNLIAQLSRDIPLAQKPLLQEYCARLQSVTDLIASRATSNMDAASFVSGSFLNAFGVIAGAVLLSRCAEKAAAHADQAFAADKEKTADFYIKNILPQAGAYLTIAETAS